MQATLMRVLKVNTATLNLLTHMISTKMMFMKKVKPMMMHMLMNKKLSTMQQEVKTIPNFIPKMFNIQLMMVAMGELLLQKK